MLPTDDESIRDIGQRLRDQRGDDYDDVRFSESEYERRYQAVREEMFFRGLDCLVIYCLVESQDSVGGGKTARSFTASETGS